jgi:hypothetical protein
MARLAVLAAEKIVIKKIVIKQHFKIFCLTVPARASFSSFFAFAAAS